MPQHPPCRVALFIIQDVCAARAVIRRPAGLQQADGIILSGTTPDDPRVGFLQDQGFSFVTCGTTVAQVQALLMPALIVRSDDILTQRPLTP